MTPNLDYIINAQNYQKIQDCLSEASDMAMVTVDYQGLPVTQHSRCSSFCALVRSRPELNNLCRKCDARGGLEAARISKPYIYQCHMGVLDLAIPIVLNSVYVGAILAGQIILSDFDENNTLEKIVETSKAPLDLEFKRNLEQKRKQLPTMSWDRVQVIANMLFQINNYIVEEAMLKITLNDQIENYSVANTENLPISKTFEKNQKRLGNQKDEGGILYKKYNNPILNPAFNYIEQHFDARFTLDNMASLCNISPSYFSKLFNRITGDNFANYVNMVRITKACELLIHSEMPITMIAFELGFEDSSYFNKVFKRLTGITPSQYKTNNSL